MSAILVSLTYVSDLCLRPSTFSILKLYLYGVTCIWMRIPPWGIGRSHRPLSWQGMDEILIFLLRNFSIAAAEFQKLVMCQSYLKFSVKVNPRYLALSTFSSV